MHVLVLSVAPNTPLGRVHRLFVSCGLRHLVVTDTDNEVSGIITRKDILPETIEDLVDFMAARIMDQLGLPHDLDLRWEEDAPRDRLRAEQVRVPNDDDDLA